MQLKKDLVDAFREVGWELVLKRGNAIPSSEAHQAFLREIRRSDRQK